MKKDRIFCKDSSITKKTETAHCGKVRSEEYRYRPPVKSKLISRRRGDGVSGLGTGVFIHWWMSCSMVHVIPTQPFSLNLLFKLIALYG
jgi:hypothetical protein